LLNLFAPLRQSGAGPKKMKKYLLFLTSLSVLAVPKITFGQTITGMLCSVTANVVRPVAIFIVVTLWVVTGILFLVAQGEPGKLATAKNALIWASA